MKIIVWLAGMLFLSGCATTPSSRLYQLAALSTTGEVHEGELLSSIRLQSVTLPGGLHSPTVITQASPVLIQSSEYERWAEPLEGQLAEIFTQNLVALLPDHHVVRGRVHPDLKADLEVHLEVLHFSGVLGEHAQIDVRWSQSRKGAGTGLHRWRGQRRVKGNDVQAYVMAQSELLAEASEALARHLAGTRTSQE